MNASRFEPGPCSDVAVEVGDYVRIALQQRFLGLPTIDVLCAAESVWNNYEPGRSPPPFDDSSADAESPVFQDLVEDLHRARSERFGHARYFIFALDYEYEAEDILFTCDLMWPGRSTITRLRLRVGRQSLAPPERN